MTDLSETQGFETGIPEIDSDHRQLLAAVEDLRDKLLDRGDRDGGLRTLEHMIALVRSHFERELALMQTRDPAFCDIHTAHYENLIAELQEGREALARNGYFGTEDMLVRQIEELLALTIRRFCSRLRGD